MWKLITRVDHQTLIIVHNFPHALLIVPEYCYLLFYYVWLSVKKKEQKYKENNNYYR